MIIAGEKSTNVRYLNASKIDFREDFYISLTFEVKLNLEKPLVKEKMEYILILLRGRNVYNTLRCNWLIMIFQSWQKRQALLFFCSMHPALRCTNIHIPTYQLPYHRMNFVEYHVSNKNIKNNGNQLN